MNNVDGKIIKASEVEINKEYLNTFLGEDLLRKMNFKNIESTSINNSEKYASFFSYLDEEADDDWSPINHFATNHFMNMLSMAFNKHKPIVLTPDNFWLLISQGVATHIKTNTDLFKKTFVKSNKKLKINIDRDDFVKGGDNNWEDVFPEFVDEIANAIEGDLVSNINLEFSTTSKNDSIAYNIALMDSLSEFIEYDLSTMCGIPEVEILGTVEDYEKIIFNLNNLKKYNLSWWIDELIPIIRTIINTLEGRIDEQFWKSIFKEDQISGGPYINGWIIKFFPYVLNTKIRKTLFGFKTKTSIIENPYFKNKLSNDLTLGDFPNGVSNVNFNWNYLQTVYKMNFTSGFIGVKENKESNRLKVEINWIVSEV